jgi:hypothetical protein
MSDQSSTVSRPILAAKDQAPRASSGEGYMAGFESSVCNTNTNLDFFPNG